MCLVKLIFCKTLKNTIEEVITEELLADDIYS